MKVLYPSVMVPKTIPKTTSVYSAKAKLKLVIWGRVAPSKGQFEAVQALKLVRAKGLDTELMILGPIGNAAYKKQITSYAVEHGFADKIHWIGFQRNPFGYVMQADVALVCSSNEAFGMVSAEAMALGKPVIATASGGTPEVVHDTKTGLLYKSGDIKELAEKILMLQSADVRTEFGIAAQKDSVRFTNTDYDKTLQRILDQAAAVGIQSKTEFTIFQDLLTGLYRQSETKEAEIAQIVQRHSEELQTFSDEYNKVYAAYNELSAELDAIRKTGLFKVYHGATKLKRGVDKARGKAKDVKN